MLRPSLPVQGTLADNDRRSSDFDPRLNPDIHTPDDVEEEVQRSPRLSPDHERNIPEPEEQLSPEVSLTRRESYAEL